MSGARSSEIPLMSAAAADRQPSYLISRWITLRLLGVIFLIAFASLRPQVLGLVGSRGILPAAERLAAVHAANNTAAYVQVPTLFWLDASDRMLTGVCLLGAGLSVLLILGVAPMPVLLLLWALYLSLVTVGQVFLRFQWDLLLLESGLLAIGYAPWTLWSRPSSDRTPSTLMRWLLWWLLFKLMFLSGATKLLSGDPAWQELKALQYHFQTQPLPNWVSWHAHHLPAEVGQLLVGVLFAIELAVPFLIFIPRLGRNTAFVLLVALQVVIEATGNFGFFNLLTIALCFSLPDDAFFRRLVPARWTSFVDRHDPYEDVSEWKLTLRLVVFALVMFVSVLSTLRELARTVVKRDKIPVRMVKLADAYRVGLSPWAERYVHEPLDPFRSINGYGLFREMTTRRFELIIEGSEDGETWLEYQCRYKPGDLERAPPIVAPHHPRLDWQLWFAALDENSSPVWIAALERRLLENSPDVLALLAESPFPNGPPKYVRTVRYEYEFSTPADKEQGIWWRRGPGQASEPVSLP